MFFWDILQSVMVTTSFTANQSISLFILSPPPPPPSGDVTSGCSVQLTNQQLCFKCTPCMCTLIETASLLHILPFQYFHSVHFSHCWGHKRPHGWPISISALVVPSFFAFSFVLYSSLSPSHFSPSFTVLIFSQALFSYRKRALFFFFSLLFYIILYYYGLLLTIGQDYSRLWLLTINHCYLSVVYYAGVYPVMVSPLLPALLISRISVQFSHQPLPMSLLIIAGPYMLSVNSVSDLPVPGLFPFPFLLVYSL